MSWSDLLRVEWWESLRGQGGVGLSDRCTRVQVRREEQEHQESWASKRDWEGRKEIGEASSVCLAEIPDILGSERAESSTRAQRRGEGLEHLRCALS